MNKHAYLIMAYNNFELLNKLIQAIDHEQNDIYLHIDAKSTSFCADEILLPERSKLFYVKREKIFWGGFSQTLCEINLLEEAVKNKYSYYHLLSGADFPIKSQDYIHNFFEKNQGFEFIGFDNNWNNNKIKYRYLFTNIGRDKKSLTFFKKIINLIYIKLQKLLRFSTKYSIKVYKGANWFSISNNLALHVLENRNLIHKNFSHILNSDEFFLQSIVGNSTFSKKVYKGTLAKEYESNMRLIDWKRGEPYTFGIEDLNELLNSKKLFVRKIDGHNGLKLVNELLKHIRGI